MGSTLFSWKSGATKALAHYSQLCWVHVLQTHRSAESKYQKVTSCKWKSGGKSQVIDWYQGSPPSGATLSIRIYTDWYAFTYNRLVWWLLLKPRISKSMIFGTTLMAGTQRLRFGRWFSFSIWVIFKGSMPMFRWENTSSIVAVTQLPCMK